METLLGQLGVLESADNTALASAFDIRSHFPAAFPPIENQGSLGSCTANAGVFLLEFYERASTGRHIDASRLFLYKATRDLLGWTGDTGAFIRTTMQAMVLFGIPPETYWPYHVPEFDTVPSPFCYSFAQNYKALQYYRLDPPGTAREDLLARIKTQLVAKLPAMFGFTVYSSYTQAANRGGAFPFPTQGEQKKGGHAVAAIGYDDAKVIQNENGGEATTGALIIRNSWGTSWGDRGYGWLPYAYITSGLAIDWWSLVRSQWVDTKVFGA